MSPRYGMNGTPPGAAEPSLSIGTVSGDGIAIGLSHAGPDATVAAVSDSCQEHWNLRPDEVLAHPLAELVSGEVAWAPPWGELSMPARVRDLRGNGWFLTTSLIDGQAMAHLEAVPRGDRPDGTLWLAEATDELQRATTLQELWSVGCESVRRHLGFDRTVVLSVDRDGDADVIAESVRGGDSLLGLRLARRLLGVTEHGAENAARHDARSNPRSMVVRDTELAPSLVVPRTDSGGRAWNLALSPLRSSPRVHLDFLRGIGAAASVTLPLIGEQGLDFVIVSHSSAPAAVDRIMRTEVELFARLLHDRVVAFDRAERLQRRARLDGLRREVVDRIGSGSIADALAAAAGDGPSVLDLVQADAAIVNVRGEQRVLGALQEHEVSAVAEAVGAWLETLSRHGALLTDRVHEVHPRLAAAAPGVRGLLAISIGSQGDSLCWVRRPLEHVVTWIDAPPADTEDAWPGTESTRGDSEPARAVRTEELVTSAEPWAEADRVAAEHLSREVEESILRRVESELAQLALVDSLTGLPNRRLLIDRLETAIARAGRGHPFALLFIDLNDFKDINDRHGHRVGDEMLVETARRMRGAVRDSDTVARLAGDEFVVLCEELRAGEEHLVMERITESFAAPFEIDGETLALRAAIGVITAELGQDAASLIDRADRAMYEAKARMKPGSGR